jgi:ABC-type nitrate/sulfonate/bicarbonate transport system permease component
MFPVWLAIRQARQIEMIDTELVLSASGLARAEKLKTYHGPKALGGLLKGVEISIGIAWLSVVAAEWIGTFSIGFWAGGLGYKIVKAHDANSWDGMLLCLVLFGGLGTATAWTWRRLFRQDRELLAGFNPLGGHGD